MSDTLYRLMATSADRLYLKEVRDVALFWICVDRHMGNLKGPKGEDIPSMRDTWVKKWEDAIVVHVKQLLPTSNRVSEVPVPELVKHTWALAIICDLMYRSRSMKWKLVTQWLLLLDQRVEMDEAQYFSSLNTTVTHMEEPLRSMAQAALWCKIGDVYFGERTFTKAFYAYNEATEIESGYKTRLEKVRRTLATEYGMKVVEPPDLAHAKDLEMEVRFRRGWGGSGSAGPGTTKGALMDWMPDPLLDPQAWAEIHCPPLELARVVPLV